MNQDDWIRERVREASGWHPLVTASVATRLGVLVRGLFAERQLTNTDRQSTAEDLLARMVPEPTSNEDKQ